MRAWCDEAKSSSITKPQSSARPIVSWPADRSSEKPDCRPEVTTSVGEDPYAAWPEDAGWEPAPICAATGASAAARPRLRAPRLRATRGPHRSWRRTPAMRNTKSQRRPNSAKRSTVTVNSLTEAACLGVGDGGVAGGEHSALRERDGVDGAAGQERL